MIAADRSRTRALPSAGTGHAAVGGEPRAQSGGPWAPRPGREPPPVDVRLISRRAAGSTGTQPEPGLSVAGRLVARSGAGDAEVPSREGSGSDGVVVSDPPLPRRPTPIPAATPEIPKT